MRGKRKVRSVRSGSTPDAVGGQGESRQRVNGLLQFSAPSHKDTPAAFSLETSEAHASLSLATMSNSSSSRRLVAGRRSLEARLQRRLEGVGISYDCKISHIGADSR